MSSAACPSAVLLKLFGLYRKRFFYEKANQAHGYPR